MSLIILKTCIKSARLRLYSSVGKFNYCSLSLYDKCLRVESILVALLCTSSIIRICIQETKSNHHSPGVISSMIYAGIKSTFIHKNKGSFNQSKYSVSFIHHETYMKINLRFS